ncbi:MAG: sigma-70 family RNA polymerase sigma factor [Flavobacteriales bacterium]|nr:MAG: sigma-70 family RNA polymerase sigma factor [Flavobacteriales bacterium]
MSDSATIEELTDRLFRHEAGRMVGALTRLFGTQHLELAEDVVQETLLKAMRDWPYHGVPENPAAWLHRVAKNLAIDQLRRKSRGVELLKENAALLRSEWTLSATVAEAFSEETIADDQLRMLFACCHPSIPQEQQVALALRTLCGFSVAEIARAFVTNEETINKRLYRAREAFRAIGRVELPPTQELPLRLQPVLATIYLLFNEGYNSTDHKDLIREDLIEEALRLGDMLVRHPLTAGSQSHALLALMLFHAARSEARLDADGAIILLADQDRSRWDRRLILLAERFLQEAGRGGDVSAYLLEAGIAGIHAHAPSFEETDWSTIVALYDRLLTLAPTAIVRFNRAIAVSKAQGAAAGLKALEAVEGLAKWHLYHAARGDLLRELERKDEALVAYDHAMDLTASPAETALLRKRAIELDLERS